MAVELTRSEDGALEFARLPSLGQFLWPMLLGPKKKAPKNVADVDRVEARARSTVVEPRRLDHYCRVCGIPITGTVPITYPQVLAGGLHGAVFTDRRFPFPLMGMIHTGNVIEQTRPIGRDESLRLRAWLGEVREVELGYGLDLITVAEADDETPWRATTTILIKKRGASRPKKSRDPLGPGDEPGAIHSAVLRAPANIGRRYAKVSGDVNLIHQYALTAKLFGFKRAIAHGMWTIARLLGELDVAYADEPTRYAVAFKTPVFLPGRMRLSARPEGQGLAIAVRSRDGSRPHVTGWIGRG